MFCALLVFGFFFLLKYTLNRQHEKCSVSLLPRDVFLCVSVAHSFIIMYVYV